MNSIIELISQIKKRPAMYIGKSYISCLHAYLDGWYFRNVEETFDAMVMNDFQTWIETKYSISTSHSWSNIILFYSQDESDALNNFFNEFDEFIKEYCSGSVSKG